MQYRNSEHYPDPTAGEAIENVYREQQEARRRKSPRTAGLRENWEDLANAVILQAVEEYREARARLSRRPGDRKARAIIRKTENFFLSRDFARLTDLNAGRLLAWLREESDEKTGCGPEETWPAGRGGNVK